MKSGGVGKHPKRCGSCFQPLGIRRAGVMQARFRVDLGIFHFSEPFALTGLLRGLFPGRGAINARQPVCPV